MLLSKAMQTCNTAQRGCARRRPFAVAKAHAPVRLRPTAGEDAMFNFEDTEALARVAGFNRQIEAGPPQM